MSRKIWKFELTIDTHELPHDELTEEYESLGSSEAKENIERSLKDMLIEWFNFDETTIDDVLLLTEFKEIF